MNLVVPVLDPALHSPDSVRQKSALLFSAVLTVTAKAVRPKAYNACVLLCNKLIGQAVEFGLSTVEVVQALLLLTHAKQPTDSSSWRKVGYAIRMAQELRLNVRAPRPLPEDERQAREILNKERAWLSTFALLLRVKSVCSLRPRADLIIADYHLAIHHTLPRMISEEDVDDPADWVAEHAVQLPCPGESTLAPWITFSRMCRLYADMLAAMTSDPSSTRSLKWLENDWRRWRSRWLGDNRALSLLPSRLSRPDPRPPPRAAGLDFLPPQISTIRLCDAFFRFHLAEYKLLWVARYRSRDRPLNTEEPSELSSAFCECVDASLALAAVFQNDFAVPGYLSFCFNLTWVSLAVVSVWLVKVRPPVPLLPPPTSPCPSRHSLTPCSLLLSRSQNIVAMSPSDRDRVIRTLNDIRSSTEDASRNSDDMSAYTHRLISHLLSTVSPAWQLSSLAAPQPSPVAADLAPGHAPASAHAAAPSRTPDHAPDSSGAPGSRTASNGAPSSHLGQYRHLDHLAADNSSAPAFPWSLATQQIIQENLYAQPAPGSSANGHGDGQHGQQTFEARHGTDAFAGMGSVALGQDDMLFPAADDDIWVRLVGSVQTFCFAGQD